MTMIRVEKNRNYTHMSNYHFWETELSAKATGILSFMMSLPDDWDYSVEGLATRFSDGRDSIKAGLKELENFGYLQRNQLRDEKGHVGKMEYVLYEIPNIDRRTVPIPEGLMKRIKEVYPWVDYPSTENPSAEKPLTENPSADYPSTEKPIQEKTNTLNTNKENTNQSIDGPMEGLVDNIREQIEYGIISQEPGTKDLLDDIVEILMELKSLSATNELVKIGKKNYQAELILHKLSRLRCSHVQYVMDCFRENPKKKSNIKAYLQQALLNATDTMDSYYESRVRSDMSTGRIR